MTTVEEFTIIIQVVMMIFAILTYVHIKEKDQKK